MKRFFHHNYGPGSSVIILVITTAMAVSPLPTRSEQIKQKQQKVSVPVKVLTSSQENTQEQTDREIGTAPQTQLEPTLPNGKLPQYELNDPGPFSEEQLNSSRLRFFLTLPSQLVLIETSITIDGKPFRMVRRHWIEKILDHARKLRKSEKEMGGTQRNDQEKLNEEVSASKSDKPKDENERQEKPVKVIEPTVPAFQPTNEPVEKLRRYMEATGRDPTLTETEWLLREWMTGPQLLWLMDHFQHFRANQRPVFLLLDRDRNGVVSSEELHNAVASFEECDLNRNNIIEFMEIAESAADHRRQKEISPPGGKLLFPVSDLVKKPKVYRQLLTTFGAGDGTTNRTVRILKQLDTNANNTLDANEKEALHERQPDLNLKVAFNTESPEQALLQFDQVHAPLSNEQFHVSTRGSTIVCSLADSTIEFSAIQQGTGNQISIGAVNDGYPLLPAIDPDDDGRFTIREMRGLVKSLQSFDHDGNGELTSEEVRAPIRICVGLGPVVHQELANIRSIHKPKVPSQESAPEWFVRMDRNSDGDLTPQEFPGNESQFDAIDADDDRLINREEARRFQKKADSDNNGSTSANTQSTLNSSDETD